MFPLGFLRASRATRASRKRASHGFMRRGIPRAALHLAAVSLLECLHDLRGSRSRLAWLGHQIVLRLLGRNSQLLRRPFRGFRLGRQRAWEIAVLFALPDSLPYDIGAIDARQHTLNVQPRGQPWLTRHLNSRCSARQPRSSLECPSQHSNHTATILRWGLARRATRESRWSFRPQPTRIRLVNGTKWENHNDVSDTTARMHRFRVAPDPRREQHPRRFRRSRQFTGSASRQGLLARHTRSVATAVQARSRARSLLARATTGRSRALQVAATYSL